jgi:hypothetical protein
VPHGGRDVFRGTDALRARTLEHGWREGPEGGNRRGDLERHIRTPAREGGRVKELFDAIDNAPPAALIAGAVVLIALLRALEWAIRERRRALAHEYLQGYAHGYRDRAEDKVPAIGLARRRDVPPAFEKAWPR